MTVGTIGSLSGAMSPEEMTLLVCAEILTGMIWFRSCAYSHSYCEFVCAMALPCAANTVSLQTSADSGPYRCPMRSSTMVAEPWMERI